MTQQVIKIYGIEELYRNLEEMPRRIRRKVLRKGVRAGSALFTKNLKQSVPIRSGMLKRTIATKVKQYTHGETVNVMGLAGQKVGTKLKETKRRRKGMRAGGISARGDVVPIHLVDQPVKPHAISGRLSIRDFHRVVSGVQHPGHRGAGFVEMAFQKTYRMSLDAFRQKAAEEIAAEAAKLPK